jgi:hypothetical protein
MIFGAPSAGIPADADGSIADARRPANAADLRILQVEANCVAKQRQGVRQFLDIMTRQYVPRPKVQACLDKVDEEEGHGLGKASACMRR